jgi:hypothetical protein
MACDTTNESGTSEIEAATLAELNDPALLRLGDIRAAGRRWAYGVGHEPERGLIFVQAVENEWGYYHIPRLAPPQQAIYDYEGLSRITQAANTARGLSPTIASEIVWSSMKATDPYERRKGRPRRWTRERAAIQKRNDVDAAIRVLDAFREFLGRWIDGKGGATEMSVVISTYRGQLADLASYLQTGRPFPADSHFLVPDLWDYALGSLCPPWITESEGHAIWETVLLGRRLAGIHLQRMEGVPIDRPHLYPGHYYSAARDGG